MQKKAQSLVIALWILVILALLAIGIAHRVSLALRLSRYHRERLKAAWLANAGVNFAIKQIETDEAEVDSLKDQWADNKEIFEKISLGEGESGFATVSYVFYEGDVVRVIFGVMDEESKININNASGEILTELLISRGVENASVLTENIRSWRGDTDISIPEYDQAGYSNKGDKFSNAEELCLVEGMSSDNYDLIKDLITVYPQNGQAMVNINTASRDVLEILVNTSFNRLEARGVEVENASGLLEAIITFREGDDGIFDNQDIELKLADLISDLQKNIITDPLDGLKSKVGVQSANYRIISQGNAEDVKLKYKINCVYSRKDKKFISWHQN
ncbi:MAG: hypothetical protein ABIH19_02600 [Candidatus Omnitrophota bacterium]